jgi:hypothetical protein
MMRYTAINKNKSPNRVFQAIGAESRSPQNTAVIGIIKVVVEAIKGGTFYGKFSI